MKLIALIAALVAVVFLMQWRVGNLKHEKALLQDEVSALEERNSSLAENIASLQRQTERQGKTIINLSNDIEAINDLPETYDCAHSEPISAAINILRDRAADRGDASDTGAELNLPE